MDFTQTLAKFVVDPLHKRLLADRHTQQLVAAAATMLPDGALAGLDIGCGSGKKAAALQALCPNVKLTGVDVLVRPGTAIPVTEFDGRTLPFADDSFDFSMLIDVLHHTDNQAQLLTEAARVSRKFVLVKDHFCNTAIDNSLLTLMDWVGNRAHGVRLPNNYLSEQQWQNLYAQCGLKVAAIQRDLALYSPLISPVFDASLHFVAKLEPVA